MSDNPVIGISIFPVPSKDTPAIFRAFCKAVAWPAIKLLAVPEQLVNTPDAGVPKAGLTSVLFVNVCVWSSNTNVSLSPNSGKDIVRFAVMVIPAWLRI